MSAPSEIFKQGPELLSVFQLLVAWFLHLPFPFLPFLPFLPPHGMRSPHLRPSIMVVPLIIGIGIDDGVHILHRYRLEGAGSMPLVLRTTGRAIQPTSGGLIRSGLLPTKCEA